MSDWVELMDDEARAEWDKFVANFREDALMKMTNSAFVAQLVPGKGSFDVKFAVELGASIMLDKPILAILLPGTEIPEKLRLIADEIVEADLDTEDGRQLVQEAFRRMSERLR